MEEDLTLENAELKEKLIILENRDKKEDQQRRMAWIAMIAMLLVTALLFTPLIATTRLEALSSIIDMFYIAQAGVVASFFTASAYMTVNKT
jgi:hypothetical protein